MCIVLVLVAVRFGLWTMMAELCFSVDDCIFLFSAIQQQTPLGNTTATGTVAAGQQRLVPLLLLPAPRQAGKACSASFVLFSYSCKNSFDLTAESFGCTIFTCYVMFGTSSNR